MTFEVTLHLIKKLRLNNFSIHINVLGRFFLKLQNFEKAEFYCEIYIEELTFLITLVH